MLHTKVFLTDGQTFEDFEQERIIIGENFINLDNGDDGWILIPLHRVAKIEMRLVGER